MTNALYIAFGSADQKLNLGKATLTVYRSQGNAHLISVRSIQKSLGYEGKSKKWPFEFLLHLNKLTPVDDALMESLSYDVSVTEKGKTVAVIMSGDFVGFLKTIVAANRGGFLYVSELKFAKAAENLLSFFETQDIDTYIDFITGFDRFKQNHRELLASRMEKSSGNQYPVWIKSLPDDFFEIILAFRNGKWEDLNQHAESYAQLLNDIIFSRIDDDLFARLELSKPKKVYSKPFSIERYRIHPALYEYIMEIVALLRTASLDASIFRQLIDKRFPKRREIQSVISQTDQKATDKLASLSENLKIAVGQKPL